MIKHIVFFKLVDELDGMSKVDIQNKLKTDLESLVDSIPELRSMEIGMNHADAPEVNFDLSLISVFDDMAGLEAYMVHPDHQKVVEFLAKVKKDRACIDYEF